VNFNVNFNPLKAQLNPICHMLALLGAHHILHISRIRVNVLLSKYIVHPVVKIKKYFDNSKFVREDNIDAYGGIGGLIPLFLRLGVR